MDVKYGPVAAVQHISLLVCRLLAKSFQSGSQSSKSSKVNTAGWESALGSCKPMQKCCLLYSVVMEKGKGAGSQLPLLDARKGCKRKKGKAGLL